MYINRKSNQGFTLIELIIVLVILGGLASVAWSAWHNATGGAQRRAQMAEDNFRAFAPSLGLKVGETLACTGTDSNVPDGYISCTGVQAETGKIITLECPSRIPGGCKLPQYQPQVIN